MSNIITDLEGDISRFGKWIESEFNSAEKLYNTLTADEKQAAQWGYGVIAVINANIDKDGALIEPLLQAAFPTLSLSTIQGFLETLVKDAGIVVADTPLTLPDAINAVKNYLSGLHGSTWEQISQALGNLIAIMFTPETPVQKFISVAELVYQYLVKPKVA